MDKFSSHNSINQMMEKIEKDEITNLKERFESQEPTRCKFCEKGTRCNICSNGPCRITSRSKRGVCGIDQDGMVMRNLAKINTMGTTAYTYHAKTTAKTLKSAAKENSFFTIKEPKKLEQTAQKLGIDTNGTTNETAIKLANYILKEIKSDSEKPLNTLQKYAPQTRIDKWEELGILPGGPLQEVMDLNTSVMTNVDGDYQSIALKSLKMGLSTTYGSLTLLETVQDIILGTAKPHQTTVDLGIIDPEYVNIVPNGHEPFMGAALIEIARKEETQQKAREAGAKGLQIIGSIETGQELMQRYETDNVFKGITGNWISYESVLATGAIDLVAADMNCTLPTSQMYAEKYNSKILPVTKLVNLPGVEDRINYNPDKVREQANEIIDMAIENYKERKDNKVEIPNNKQEITTGFSPEAVINALGGTLDPLIENIANGNIKGIVALVSCTTLKNGPQDQTTINVTKELISKDILVLSAGCGNAGLQIAGLTSQQAIKEAGEGLQTVCNALEIPPVLSFGTCTDTGRLLNLVSTIANELDVDPTQLPVAVTAPEYMEQKATIAAIAAVAYGLYTHVSPTPPITGSENVVKLLTQDIEQLTGGKIAVGDNPTEIANDIENHINKKRQELGL
ncbi:anaerobic carbon-monoxide dehydrogenase catalytic subunit [Methanonatronarchaeum sp. AMET-Sl]|uniref:anaerobic carbon-monoxide dehydrogenase catalytic subunit n=1 Tax=Methanonatronarchaeum sp. AMET-Sl TaxID=3037654 RepID=UPI00244E4778|nr:anaerobic carbon-monoxide dehydrogenase catalytic subunit [Methanonatronarchaeum sp. AMET-Sl]WGI18043.1 anaerobic carbon-monoxide dehydrogenase catalytic subunit [Methanonatronarchaeum sp. AMET-Sl]